LKPFNPQPLELPPLLTGFDIPDKLVPLYQKYAPLWKSQELNQSKKWNTFIQASIPTTTSNNNSLQHNNTNDDSDITDINTDIIVREAVRMYRGALRRPLDHYSHPQLVSQLHELRMLVHMGLPPNLRGQLWSLFLLEGNTAMCQPGLYKDLYTQALSQDQDDWIVQIDKDLHRTWPGNLDKDGRQGLRRVLAAYSKRNPKDVGYCQGLNFIAATFLLLIKDEETAFWCMAVFVEQVLDGYYDKDMIAAAADLLSLEHLIHSSFPKVYHHLKKVLGVDFPSVTGSWLIVAFLNTLPFEACLRIWDILLFEQSPVLLIQIALALVDMYQDALLETSDSSEAYMLLQQMGGLTYDVDRLLDLSLLTYGKINDTTLSVLRARYGRQGCPSPLKLLDVVISIEDDDSEYDDDDDDDDLGMKKALQRSTMTSSELLQQHQQQPLMVNYPRSFTTDDEAEKISANWASGPASATIPILLDQEAMQPLLQLNTQKTPPTPSQRRTQSATAVAAKLKQQQQQQQQQQISVPLPTRGASEGKEQHTIPPDDGADFSKPSLQAALLIAGTCVVPPSSPSSSRSTTINGISRRFTDGGSALLFQNLVLKTAGTMNQSLLASLAQASGSRSRTQRLAATEPNVYGENNINSVGSSTSIKNETHLLNIIKSLECELSLAESKNRVSQAAALKVEQSHQEYIAALREQMHRQEEMIGDKHKLLLATQAQVCKLVEEGVNVERVLHQKREELHKSKWVLDNKMKVQLRRCEERIEQLMATTTKITSTPPSSGKKTRRKKGIW